MKLSLFNMIKKIINKIYSKRVKKTLKTYWHYVRELAVNKNKISKLKNNNKKIIGENYKPYILYSRPGSVFLQGEKIYVSVFNPCNIPLEILFIQDPNDVNKNIAKLLWKQNPVLITPDAKFTGDFIIVARSPIVKEGALIRSNSIRGKILPLSQEHNELVQTNREAEHRFDCAIERTSSGVLSLHNPWILPGYANNEKKIKWFPIPVFEGATSLYNELPEYYTDPLLYFSDCISALKSKKYRFITWHDILDKRVDDFSNCVLLQFDIDAGPNSFHHVASLCDELGIVGNVMLHRKAKYWYEYDIEDLDINYLRDLESKGWTFGYHNNALTNIAGYLPENLTEEERNQASKNIIHDVTALRAYFDIRTLTHHGGNVLNNTVKIPDEADVICVDRPFASELWSSFKKTFSDGGFSARPEPLKAFVEQVKPNDGSIFMRCHPLKYGNYPNGSDINALSDTTDLVPDIDVVNNKIVSNKELNIHERQVAWWYGRFHQRTGERLGFADPYKKLSSKFKFDNKIINKIKTLRSERRSEFLRIYPWEEGDPRVIWWHLMSVFAKQGPTLNVGAMPLEQKHETYQFLPEGSELIELDIDPDREPELVMNFCDDSIQLDRKFITVLLNGLPYFSKPDVAIRNSAKVLSPGGVLLIGAAAASHPERGGMFRPEDRPIWRADLNLNCDTPLSLSTKLWSFDDESISGLMSSWPGKVQSEFISNYWFIVAQKQEY